MPAVTAMRVLLFPLLVCLVAGQEDKCPRPDEIAPCQCRTRGPSIQVRWVLLTVSLCKGMNKMNGFASSETSVILFTTKMIRNDPILRQEMERNFSKICHGFTNREGWGKPELERSRHSPSLTKLQDYTRDLDAPTLLKQIEISDSLHGSTL